MVNLTFSTTHDIENPDLHYMNYREEDILDIAKEVIFRKNSMDVFFLEGYTYVGLLATLLFQFVALPVVVVFVIAIYSTLSADLKVFSI